MLPRRYQVSRVVCGNTQLPISEEWQLEQQSIGNSFVEGGGVAFWQCKSAQNSESEESLHTVL